MSLTFSRWPSQCGQCLMTTTSRSSIGLGIWSTHSYHDSLMHAQDAHLSMQQLCDHYTELVLIMRKLYQECRLVHADLSEFNILVHEV